MKRTQILKEKFRSKNSVTIATDAGTVLVNVDKNSEINQIEQRTQRIKQILLPLHEK